MNTVRNLAVYAFLALCLLIIILSYNFQDYLVLDRDSFGISVAILRITTLFLLLFTSITLIVLGPKIVSLRFYILGLLLLPSLIPDLFHIMSI
ncbi:MAG: hypothetical protein NZM36_06445, partial [Aquificaceae bacterium]|nr:hypothetical protein [Aquificaceae bacterium]